MTPRMLDLVCRGALRRMAREHNERMVLAWHVAKLTAYAPKKSQDFVKIDRLLTTDTTKTPRRQTWQQQLALTSNW